MRLARQLFAGGLLFGLSAACCFPGSRAGPDAGGERMVEHRVHVARLGRSGELLNCTDFTYRYPAGLTFDHRAHAMSSGTRELPRNCGETYDEAPVGLCRANLVVPQIPDIHFSFAENYYASRLSDALNAAFEQRCVDRGGRWLPLQ